MGEIGNQFEELVNIVSRLRAPGGCPWDLEQTHDSLKRNLLEECYEVLEAIDRGEPRPLAEELGDLLVQIALHVDIAREAGDFELSAVLTAITSKLVRRHPHVFGDVTVAEMVAHVTVHEFAHHFGWSDDDIAAIDQWWL